MIKNRKPIYEDTVECLKEFDLETQERACAWMKKYLIPRKSPNRKYSGYSLKHRLQAGTDIYLYTGAFKALMIRCGFETVKPDDGDCFFCISDRSPGLDWRLPRGYAKNDVVPKL
ncbi:MAG TPA: hypothetical protein VHO94_02250 [Oscillospiraceae bacterium]|nr:hypothetical protein [Oscillospiraceae bacterium]